jgi:hypothetical protein
MPDGKPDTGPLPEISEQARERLEEEHEERLAEPADAGDWK